MIIIADSGSTKTEWTLLTGSLSVTLRTQGLNPFHMGDDAISSVLTTELLPQIKGMQLYAPSGEAAECPKVYFYGAGCTPETAKRMSRLLQNILPNASVETQGDLMAAARALCQRHEGVVCILGTGANSCLYDGKSFVANTPPLGFILGDEGSGADLGKHFLNGIFKGWLPSDLKEAFLHWSHMTYPDVIDRIYRQPLANRFLASIVPFLEENIEQKEIKQLITNRFTCFFQLNVLPYGRQDLPVNFIGGVAWQFKSLLESAAAVAGCRLGKVEKTPMGGLIVYHRQAV